MPLISLMLRASIPRIAASAAASVRQPPSLFRQAAARMSGSAAGKATVASILDKVKDKVVLVLLTSTCQ